MRRSRIISANELSNGSSGPQLRCMKLRRPVCRSRRAGMHGRLPTKWLSNVTALLAKRSKFGVLTALEP
jgi:hypothetical protein